MFLSATNPNDTNPDYLREENDYLTGYASIYAADESLSDKCITGIRRYALLDRCLQKHLKSLEENKTALWTKISKCKAAIDKKENVELNTNLIAYYEQGQELIKLAINNLKELHELNDSIKDSYKKAQELLKENTPASNQKAEALCDKGNDYLTRLTTYYFSITELFFIANNHVSYFAANLLLNQKALKNDPTLRTDYEELSKLGKEIALEFRLVIEYYIKGERVKARDAHQKVRALYPQAQQRCTDLGKRFDKLITKDTR